MFGFVKRTSSNKTPLAPADTVVWAIGDIHGRFDLIHDLASWILRDLEKSSASRKVMIFLGDYIDRGPQSREVIDLMCALADMPQIETHFLRGNHEERFEAVLADPEMAIAWCEYGGAETMRSYGAPPPLLPNDVEGWVASVAALNANLPDRHRAFLARQEYSLALGDYFFAHAGVRPGVPLEKQTHRDLMWIRQEFLVHPKPFDKIVVHGHTPTVAVQSDRRRIGLDTGAYATGVLSGMRFEGSNRRLAQTSVYAGKVSIREDWA